MLASGNIYLFLEGDESINNSQVSLECGTKIPLRMPFCALFACTELFLVPHKPLTLYTPPQDDPAQPPNHTNTFSKSSHIEKIIQVAHSHIIVNLINSFIWWTISSGHLLRIQKALVLIIIQTILWYLLVDNFMGDSN